MSAEHVTVEEFSSGDDLLDICGPQGHKVCRREGKWFWQDTGLPRDNGEKRPCVWCKAMPTSEGHDACLGTLDGVTNACCGHSVVIAAYVTFEDGRKLEGEDALSYFLAEGRLPQDVRDMLGA